MTRDDASPAAVANGLPEKRRYLAMLMLAPAIWMAHFLASYVTAAVWCARYAGADGALDPVRSAVTWYTAAALAGIVAVAWSGFARHRHEEGNAPHDQDTPEDRHRFLGFATVLLAGLSAVATIFVGLTPAFFGTCR